MSRHILLDSTPLGILTKPQRSTQVQPITLWTVSWLAAGQRIYLPELIDYELRRELVRAGKTTSPARLDGLKTRLRYLPITTAAILMCAKMRRLGQSRRDFLQP